MYILHITGHTSHVTRHTSHVTGHTSHVTRHTSHLRQLLAPAHTLSLQQLPLHNVQAAGNKVVPQGK